MSPEARESKFSQELEKALLEFFASTTVSAAILDCLAESGHYLDTEQILEKVRDIRRLEIPRTAVKSSILILSDAKLVTSANGMYRLTETGEELAAQLKTLRPKLV